MVEATLSLGSALAATRELLDDGWDHPIFEATLEYDGVLVRIDILEPDGSGAWRLAEVKSTTQPKGYHSGDLATQLWVAKNAGLSISQACIRHIDSSFVLEREGDFAGLFSDSNLTAEIRPIVEARSEVVVAARDTLAGDEPQIGPGIHCDSPFPCGFAVYCSAGQQAGPDWPVTILPNGGGKRWLERGISDLRDVELEALANPLHHRVHQATLNDELFHDVSAARSAIGAWPFPRIWLDFETISFALPRWVGTRPFQQVPFQFSAHIEEEDGEVSHVEFLSLDGSDPRRSCAESLVSQLPVKGAVIGYNASFEKGRILELAAAFPDLCERLHQIADRVVDLLPVARDSWYHRDQRGSWSIKSILPTVAPELDYGSLAVRSGLHAQEAYLEAIAEEPGTERWMRLDQALRAYCGRDTEAMMVLSRRLTQDLGVRAAE